MRHDCSPVSAGDAARGGFVGGCSAVFGFALGGLLLTLLCFVMCLGCGGR